jgi:hypothetical protein
MSCIVRADRLLDAPRFVEEAFQLLGADFGVHDGADDAERHEQVLGLDARVHVEGDEVLALSERDRGEAVDAELALEILVHRGILDIREDEAVLFGALERRVRCRDRHAGRRLLGAPEPALEHVLPLAVHPEPATRDSQLR